MFQSLITVVLVFAFLGGMLFLLIGGYQTVAHEQTPVEVRLTQIQKRRPIETEVVRGGLPANLEGLSLAEREELLRAPKKMELLPFVTRRLSRNSFFAKLDEDLQKAHSNWRASELVVGCAFLMLLTMILVYLVTKNSVLSLCIGLGTLFLPHMYIRFIIARWMRQFNDQLPDTLTLMSNGLKAGYSFLQAIELVGRESLPPICDEFRRVSHEISVGVPVEDSMEAFGSRINTMDVDLLVTAVLIQREVGGALAEILDTIAEVIRERLRIQGEIRTLTTQGKITGTGLALMPIALGLAIHLITSMMTPPGTPPEEMYMYPLLHTPIGKKIMFAAGFQQFIGFMIIRKIVNIEI